MGEEDPVAGSLVVCVNRWGNYVKLVSWDRTGGGLLAKRVEHGRLRFPPAEVKQELRLQVFQLLLSRISEGYNLMSCTQYEILSVRAPKSSGGRRRARGTDDGGHRQGV